MHESVISIYRAQPKMILNYKYVFSILTFIMILYVIREILLSGLWVFRLTQVLTLY